MNDTIPAPISRVTRRKGYSSYFWRGGKVFIFDTGYSVQFDDLAERDAYEVAHGGVRDKEHRSWDTLQFSF